MTTTLIRDDKKPAGANSTVRDSVIRTVLTQRTILVGILLVAVVAAVLGAIVMVDLITNRVRASRQESPEIMRARHTNLE